MIKHQENQTTQRKKTVATYNLSLSAKWSSEVGRSPYEAGDEVEIDELYPDEMEENTDGECPLLDVAQEIFPTLVVEDTETGEQREITLNPFGDNPEAISYSDCGEFFDESDLSDGSWLYCCKVGDKVNWSCVLEIRASDRIRTFSVPVAVRCYR